MSFLIDPPLLVASGAGIEAMAGEQERRSRYLSVATVAGFVAVSAALYANAPGLGRLWRPFGVRSGREFMLTSGVLGLDTERLRIHHHLLALSSFLLYPAWVRLGRRLGRWAAGS